MYLLPVKLKLGPPSSIAIKFPPCTLPSGTFPDDDDTVFPTGMGVQLLVDFMTLLSIPLKSSTVKIGLIIAE